MNAIHDWYVNLDWLTCFGLLFAFLIVLAWVLASGKDKPPIENRFTDEYIKGNRFAWRALRKGTYTPDELWKRAEEASDFGNFTDFDRGVLSAVKDFLREQENVTPNV